jgi:hypothetical protein
MKTVIDPMAPCPECGVKVLDFHKPGCSRIGSIDPEVMRPCVVTDMEDGVCKNCGASRPVSKLRVESEQVDHCTTCNKPSFGPAGVCSSSSHLPFHWKEERDLAIAALNNAVNEIITLKKKWEKLKEYLDNAGLTSRIQIREMMDTLEKP